MNIENSIINDCKQSRKNYKVLENGLVPIHRKTSPSGLVRISQSNAAKKLAESFYDDAPSHLDQIKSEASTDKNEKPKKKKSKKHKKHKKDKKAKKMKKQQKKKVRSYSEQLDTSSRRVNNGKVLSRILTVTNDVVVVNNSVYIYDEDSGMYNLSDENTVSTKLNSWIDNNREDNNLFNSRDNKEAYQSIITFEDIQREEFSNSYNTSLVLCRNGVLDLDDMSLKKYSPKYEFTSGIKAEYNEKAEGPLFMEYLEFVTNGDKEMKKLIQEIVGYAFSSYSFLRKTFIFHGDKGTGKSTILELIRELSGGEKCVCNVPISIMDKEYYIANILDSKLNIVPDHPADVIKDISRFNSFVSDSDNETGRNPFEKPIAKRCRTKMLFGTNHPFNFVGLSREDVEAFFDRAIFIPFNKYIENRIYGYGDMLVEKEADFIFTWAMKGMKRLKDNNFKFTKCHIAENFKTLMWSQYFPQEAFFKECLKKVDDERFESSLEITDSFKLFCRQQKIKGSYDISCFLEEQGIFKTRKRIDEDGRLSNKGNPIYVYPGIRLKGKYRVS